MCNMRSVKGGDIGEMFSVACEKSKRFNNHLVGIRWKKQHNLEQKVWKTWDTCCELMTFVLQKMYFFVLFDLHSSRPLLFCCYIQF